MCPDARKYPRSVYTDKGLPTHLSSKPIVKGLHSPCQCSFGLFAGIVHSFSGVVYDG